MSNAFDPETYHDSKIKETLEMLSQGFSKEDITKHFGNKDWKTIYIYFNRRGFCWDSQANTFVPKDDEGESIWTVDSAQFSNTKAGKIVRQLSQKKANIRQIAQRNGFKTVEEMGEYMKGQQYVWNADESNYNFEEMTQPLLKQQLIADQPFRDLNQTGQEGYQQLLQYLFSKQDRLIALLESESDGTLPRYKFRGGKVSKTLGLSTSLQALLGDFSVEFNITQRAIVEIALAEFFKKYGYEDQLNQALHL